jgi:hypothetical protein
MGPLVDEDGPTGVEGRFAVLYMKDLIPPAIHEIFVHAIYIIAQVSRRRVRRNYFVGVRAQDNFVFFQEFVLLSLQHIPVPSPVHYGVGNRSPDKTAPGGASVRRIVVKDIHISRFKEPGIIAPPDG